MTASLPQRPTRRISAPPDAPPGPTAAVAAVEGTFKDVVALLEGFRRELWQRMDELEDKVDRKFDGLPAQYVPRREFDTLAAHVERLEERVFSEHGGRYRDLLNIDQHIERVDRGRLRDDMRRMDATYTTAQSRWASWQIALFGAGVSLACTVLSIGVGMLISYISSHP